MSRPAGWSTSSFEADTLLMMCSTFQPSWSAATIACAPNFGVLMFRNVSASESASLDICEETVGSVTS